MKRCLYSTLAILSICIIAFVSIFETTMSEGMKYANLCYFKSGVFINDGIENNVGWRAENKFIAMFIANLKSVDFVRFSDVNNEEPEYDLIYLGGDKNKISSYYIDEADVSRNTVYRIVDGISKVENYESIRKSYIEVVDDRSEKEVLGYYKYEISFVVRDAFPSWLSFNMVCEEAGFNLENILRRL